MIRLLVSKGNVCVPPLPPPKNVFRNWIIVCLISCNKYLMHIQDKKKFNNIYKLYKKWGKDTTTRGNFLLPPENKQRSRYGWKIKLFCIGFFVVVHTLFQNLQKRILTCMECMKYSPNMLPTMVGIQPFCIITWRYLIEKGHALSSTPGHAGKLRMQSNVNP